MDTFWHPELWETGRDWVDAHREALAALALTAVFALPFIGLRAVIRHSRKRRARRLFAELDATRQQIWTLRSSATRAGFPKAREGAPAHRPKTIDSRLVAPMGIVQVIALPFENRVDDAKQADLVDGFTHDLLTLLDQRPNITMAPVTYSREADATVGMAMTPEGDFILDGSIELIGGASQPAVRLTLQLLEATSGERVFSDRFEGPVRRLAGLQDDIAESIAGALGSLMRPNRATAETAAPDGVTSLAWALYQRGYSVRTIGISRQRLDAAVRVYDHAARLDPGFAAAKRELAKALAMRALHLTSPDTQADLERAEAVLEAARVLAEQDPELALAEGVLCLARSDTYGARKSLKKTAAHGPLSTEAALVAQWTRLYDANPTGEAAAWPDLDGIAQGGVRALAHMLVALEETQNGALDQALARLEAVNAEASAYHMGWLLKAQVLALLGRADEAQGTFARARRVMGPADPMRVRTWIMRAAGTPERAQAWANAFTAAWG